MAPWERTQKDRARTHANESRTRAGQVTINRPAKQVEADRSGKTQFRHPLQVTHAAIRWAVNS